MPCQKMTTIDKMTAQCHCGWETSGCERTVKNLMRIHDKKVHKNNKSIETVAFRKTVTVSVSGTHHSNV